MPLESIGNLGRRELLQLGATGLAGGLLTGWHPLSAADTSGNRIRMGQIGTRHAHASGQIATARDLADLYEVVGVVEPDDAQYARVAQQPAYQGVPRLTVEELLSTSGLQVVAVETDVRDLLKTARLCLEAGLHIHLDKPAGESYEELVRLHLLAREKSLTIQMGYMFRYNSAFQFLFEAARQGWLGEIFEVHGVISKTVGAAERRQLAEYPGGSMFELGCHLIDPLLHLLGRPDNVVPFNRRTLPEDSLYDNMLAVFEYPHATATIRSSLLEVEGGRRRQFVVCGTAGTITIRPLEPARLELTLNSPQGDYRAGTQQVTLPASEGRYHGAWRELAAVIQGERTFPFTSAHDLAVQQAVLTASGLRKFPAS